MIYFLGDMHVTTSHPWDVPFFEKFIEWFNSINFESESTLIQLGDVFDKSCNYGETTKYVTKFFKVASTKFKKIYILGGNHDLGLSKNKYQYATSYLEECFDNIECVFDEKILEIENTKIGFMPHKKIKGKTLVEYYDDLDNFEADIYCGHVGLKEPSLFFEGINADKLKGEKVMGHIHTRNGVYKEYYAGSIRPLKINEVGTELPREIIAYKEKEKQIGIQIPELLKFKTIYLGDEIDDYPLTLYTVKNCNREEEAKKAYPNAYIYSIEKPTSVLEVKVSSKTDILLTPEQALKMLVKELKLKRDTYVLVNKLLKNFGSA